MKKPTILKMPHFNLLTLFSKRVCTSFKTIFIAIPFEPTTKKRFLSHAFAMVGILLFMNQASYGQALKSFGKRYDETLRGDVLVIGNNILNRDFGTNGNRANDPYNVQGSSSIYNEDTNMKWINIDPDGGKNFNSSSAKLTIPTASQSCYKIVYAALYWSGTYSIAATNGSASGADRSKINKVRFKVGTGSYVELTGNVIYDYIGTSGGTGAMSPATAQSARNPYACMLDVTSYVQAGGPVNYTVGNVASSEGGQSTSAGHSAGWSLFVVYEDPKQPRKFITSFDGFARIKAGDPAFTFSIDGFRTIPSGPVKAKLAFAALEGDNLDVSDYMDIKGATIAGSVSERLTTPTIRPIVSGTPNFFNSSISNGDTYFTDRVPNSINTLGYDTGILTLSNPSNNTIKNTETKADITLGTGYDWYYLFFTALAIEVIEPKIILTKKVFYDNGLPAENKSVGLGDILTYQLQFQNVGNDNAKNFTITDQLPVNTIFNYPADIETPLPAGVTHTYNSATRTITFTIADNLVQKNGNLSDFIRFKVQVVPTCANLTEPCNNIIKNTAKSKYTGEINTNGGLGFGEDSFSSYSACDISVPESTNFLVGVDDCKARNAVLCGDPLTISASGGYASYSWSTSPTGVPVIGTTQTITVTQPGTYYVKNTATPPCVDLEEVITVSGYDAKFNPLVKYADNKDAVTGLIPVCPNDGSVLPKIFLCTEDDKVDIDLSDLGATNITWETTTCVADPNLSDLCANESTTCTWTQAGPPGATFVANTAGQYRVSMSFGGCFSRFYFNVYKNGLKPTVTKKDIICGNNGSITIGGISGTGYEYSLSENSGYTSNNTFSISTAGTYTVYIRQVGVATNPCPFKVEGISIYKTDFDPIAPFVTQPLCHDSKGSIKVYGTAYNGAQYTYELFKGGVSIEKVINSTASEYEFLNKDAGSYTYTVTTLDGCSYNGVAEIIAPAALTAVASISKPLTCANGEITVTPTNGTAPYYYYVNGSATSQTDPKIVITTAGTYSILVRDKNNCSYTIPDITINANPKPVFTVAKTDILCYGAKSGVITFNVTNANGYTLAYSIDNGLNYVANGTFSSLAPGTYKPIVKYTLSGVDCFETRPDIIITEPAVALTASAGVSELAGCGDGVTIPKNYGRVRITNPQGGVAPYEYSFDNQATWSPTIMDAYKAPGTYTLYVRDANKCIFSASVIVDPEPAEPVINVTPKIDFNCDGTATSTVTVDNPPNASYTYDYYLNDVKNTNIPSNVFVNVPSGSHSIKVEYKLNAVPTFSNLLFENFGYGDDTTSPGINTAFYCFERQVVATPCRGSNAINDGDYSVTSFIVNPFGAWVQPGDHTPQTVPPTPKGRSLVVNIGDQIATSDILYQKVINDIIPNQPINFELYAMNLLKTGNTQVNADLRVALVDASGTEISWFATGEIPKTQIWEQYPKTPVTLNPGDNTTLRFIIRSNKRATSGNDVAIDDIKVFQLPKTCISSRSFPLVIDAGKAFTAQITGQKNVTCNGLTNGEFTITATNFDTTKGYQYSTNNGATWSAALFTSPVPVNNLAGNLYKVIVRPVGSTIATCSIPFDVTISVPTALTLSASVTTPATCTTGATITAIGGGGTPTYQYQLRQSNGTTVTAFVNNGGVFTNVPAGSYTVFVRDANNCQIPVGVSVSVTAPPALTAALATTTDYCYTTANPARLDVEVTGGTGPFTYKLNSNAAISSAATTYSFTNVAPGPHTIVVTDSNNCTAPISSIVIAPQLGLTVSLLNDLTCLANATIGNPVVTGGNPGVYSYTVTHGGITTAATFPYPATTPGTYVFTVTDSQGCTANSNTITVTAKTTPTITTNKTDITCNNANNGTITVTAAGGFTSAYTYEIAGPVTISQTTNKFTGLSAGTYNVKVIDSKGCESAVSDVIIVNPTPIVVNATVTTPFSCSSSNTKQAALITVTPTGGTGTYTYSYDNGGTFGNNATRVVNDNGLTQTFNIVVKDANGCLSPVQVVALAPLNKPTDLAFANAAVTCTATTTTVSVTATNGVGALSFLITGTNSGTAASNFGPITTAGSSVAADFPNLLPGNYTFRVTDANGCYYTELYTVAAVTPIAVTATKLTDVDCFGSTTGSARFTVSNSSGGPGSYTVVTSPVIPPAQIAISGNVYTITGLANGTYTFSVTDNTTGCTDSKSVIISQPTAALGVTIVSNKNANCNVATARVEVLASGGTPNYRYSFVTSATTPGAYGNSPIANLNPTTSTSWYAHVIDAKGCTFILPITIATDPTPAVTASGSGCLGTVGGYTLTATNTTSPASGIIAPITYSLNGGAFQAGTSFTITASGSYTIRMQDGNGCIVSSNTVVVAPQLTLNAVLNKDITCNPAPTAAQITLTPTGGSGSFTYESKEALGVFTAMASNIFTTNTAGSYTFRVTDTVTGCTYTTTSAIAVTTPVNPDITGLTQTATINCNGDDTGAIKATYNASLGLAPFQFSIDGTTFQNSDTFTGLSAGTYTVTIRDAKGCTDTQSITISEPTLITFVKSTTPITCNNSTGFSLGSITINSASGGTPNYTYHVTGVNGYDVKFNNQTGATAVFDVVDFGLYQIIITDANGCTAFENNILIASPPNDLDILVTPVGPTCAGLGSAEISIGALSSITGSGPFHFAVYSPGLTYTGPTALLWYDEDAVGSKKTTIPNLIPGVTYTFIVHDALTGCYYYETSTIAIPTNSTITVSPLTPNNITCKGAADGNVTFTMNHTYGVATPVTYQIYNSQSVTPVGSVVATTIPAVGSLVISNFGTLPFGNYFVLVTETGTATHAGCSISSAPFDITESAIDLSITANVIKNSNCNDLGVITGQAKDGTAPYTYQVVPAGSPVVATGWVSTNTFTRAGSLVGIDYDVHTKDAYGCDKFVTVKVLQDASPAISVPTPICYNGTAFTINLVTDAFATATIGPATYSVNGSAFQSSPSFTFNAAGTYNLVIKDGNGCTANVDYEVYPKLELSAAVTKVPDCTLTPNAEMTLTVTGGNTNPSANYTYEVSTTGGAPWTTMPTNVHSVAPVTVSTTFTFRVTDANNPTTCQTTTSIVLDPIPTTVFTTTETNVSCNGGSDGTITVNVTAGEGPFEYQLDAGAFQTSNQFTGLPAGTTYVVTVRNAKQCTLASSPITIAEPSALFASSLLTTKLSCGAGNVAQTATVTVTGIDGTAPYEYSFDNGTSYSTTNTYQSNVGITFDVLVKDAKGCVYTLSNGVNIPALVPPTNMDINGTPVYCLPVSSQTSTVTITTTNGVGTLTYAILSPATATGNTSGATSGIFTLLAPDTYTFQVTDANGCTYQESYTVAPVTNITVAASATTDVTCFGFANGTATFDVANFAGNYNYTFDGAPTNGVNTAQLTFTALSPGLHTLVVTDAITGCQAIVPVAVSQPAAALDFTATATKINCNNDEATITVVATGGTADYKYAVVPVGGTPAASAFGLSNLLTVDTNTGANMVWDVYVMDANGCIDSDSVTIQTDANPTNITLDTTTFSECPDPINGTYTFTINTPTGVGPFTYSIGGGFQTSPTFVVNAPGSYDVTVKDANGCPTTEPALVVIRQPLILTPTVTTPVSCANGDGVIAVSTTGGSNILANYQYKIDSGSYPMTTPFTGLAFGTHRVYVQDIATGCEVFADIDLQQATPITGFALATTSVTCNGGFDGTITATMFTPALGINDNPVYTYTLTGTTTVGNLPVTRPAQASPLFTGLAAGTYTVVVTSERGCTDTDTITIIEPGLITVPAPTVVQFACTSGNTGNLATITVDPTLITGGSNTYLNYEFIKVGTPTNTVVQFSNSNVYTEANLLGGSYIVNVYDDKGCIGTSTATITIAPYIQLDKLNVNVTRAITCTNLEDIAVSVSAIGGTPANLQFTVRDVIYDNSVTPPTAIKETAYSLPPVSVVAGVATFTNLPVGNYEITVRNLDTNCEITSVHYVNNPNTFELTIDNVVDVTCLNDANGSARVTLVDRVPTPVNNAGEFTYTLADALGNPLPGGISTTAGVVDLTNLAVGTYTITATLNQTPFCTVSKNFTITGPSEILAISETHTEITCVTGNNDGSISATATGGWPGGYEFRLEETLAGTVVADWSTIKTFNGLTAGNYVVKVRDSKRCEVFTTVVLNNPTPIAFTTTTINQALQCNGDTNASITVSVPTGGQGSNYLYTLNTTSATPMISSGPQSGNVFNNLGAGTYTVTVTDGWGCGTPSAAIDITEPTEVVASLVLATTQTCFTQSTLTLSATGGTGTYTYSADGTFNPTGSLLTYGTFATTTTILNVPVGTYRYYVRDANQCISVVSNDIKIEPLPTLQVALDVQNAKINCRGDANGVIVATATGGLGNYVYTLLDGVGGALAFTPVQTTPGNFTQLPAGTYSVRVDSGDCQETSVSEVIEEPLLPVTASTVVIPVTCNGAANGIITVTASGGTGVIKYAISPRLDQFFDTGVFDQLAPGTYQIIVQDENGCFIPLSEEITEPQPIFVNTVAGSEEQELCAGDNNAAFVVNITGGVAPYSVAIDDINGTYVTGALSQTVFNFTDLSGGEHTVYIKDANGCPAEWIVTLDESVNLDPKATVAYGCDNNSPSNTVTVTVDASITNPADVDYALDGSTVFQASNIFSNVAPGFHTITARHTNGCEKTTIQFEVLGFTPLALTLSDGGLNEIVATATGGAGNYQYSFDGGNTFSSNNKLIYYKSGDYTVIVRDANGCEATATRYFEFIDIEIPNVFTPNGDGNNDTWTPTNTINYKDLTINIFDRYGRKVATLREGQGWDGKYNSLELPSGDYWYVLKLKNVQDDREFVGHFTLMR